MFNAPAKKVPPVVPPYLCPLRKMIWASGHLGIWAWNFKATKAREEILPEVLQPDVSGVNVWLWATFTSCLES